MRISIPPVEKTVLTSRPPELAFHRSTAEGGGFVETEAGSGVAGLWNRITLDSLEGATDDAEVVVKMRIEAGAEAVEEAHGFEGGRGRSRWAGL